MYASRYEIKHLVQSLEVSTSSSLDRDEDSYGTVSTSVSADTSFVVTALCEETFLTREVTMFGDADLCEKCVDAFKKLPRYVR